MAEVTLIDLLYLNRLALSTGIFPLGQCQFPLCQFPFGQLPTSSIPTSLIPIWSMLMKWELTKWELTKWELTKWEVDEPGIDKVHLKKLKNVMLHCKNIWVTSTILWSSQLHACCVRDMLQTSRDASNLVESL